MSNEHLRKQMNPLSDTDLAYLAGLFDGEGSIGVRFRKRPGNTGGGRRLVLTADLFNTHLPVLSWAKERTGIGTIYERKRYPNRQQCYVWMLSSYGAEQFLRALLPFLKVKAEQAALGLEVRALGQPKPYERIPESDFERGVSLREQIMSLNGGNKSHRETRYTEV